MPDDARSAQSKPVHALLLGRVAVVTGASSGIGAAACAALADDGAHVVAVARDPERLASTVADVECRTGGASRVLGLALDVTREEDMEEMAACTVETFGRLDVLVTAAGTLRGANRWPRHGVDMTIDEWEEVIRANLTGVYLSNRAVVPIMAAQGHGDIVNISSTSGLKGLAFDAAYCASKFGVIGLSQVVAEDARTFGVRVHVLLPGAVDTQMWRQSDAIPHLGPALPAERLGAMIRHIVAVPDGVQLSNLVVTPFDNGSASGGLVLGKSASVLTSS